MDERSRIVEDLGANFYAEGEEWAVMKERKKTSIAWGFLYTFCYEYFSLSLIVFDYSKYLSSRCNRELIIYHRGYLVLRYNSASYQPYLKDFQ
jgi:hypothetical protein